MIKKALRTWPYAPLVSFGVLTVYYLVKYFNLQRGMNIIDLQEPQKVAIDLFFKQLTTIGELSLALIGGAWALVIYTESSVRITSTNEKLLFAGVNSYFLGSFIMYLLGNNFLLSRLFWHSSIDLDAPIVDFWQKGQIFYFVGGLFTLGLMILIAYRPKKGATAA